MKKWKTKLTCNCPFDTSNDLSKKDVETEFEVDEEEDETLWWSSVCKGGMSVSGMNSNTATY